MVLSSGQSTAAARQLAGVSGHAGHPPALAPLDGGQALDLRAAAGSSGDRQRASSADPSFSTGKSAMGLSAHCGRVEGPRHLSVGYHGEEDPARGTARAGRHAQRSIMA